MKLRRYTPILASAVPLLGIGLTLGIAIDRLADSEDKSSMSLDEIILAPGFAGIHYDTVTHSLVLSASSNLAFFEGKIRENGDNAPWILKSVEFDVTEANATMDKLKADIDALKSEGVNVSAFGYDESRNRVVVEVTSDLGMARDSLRTRYGQIVEVVAGLPYVELN